MEMQTLMETNENTASREDESLKYKPSRHNVIHKSFVASDKFNCTLKHTETYACRPHTDSVCYWWCYLAPLQKSGRFEAGQPFVSSI